MADVNDISRAHEVLTDQAQDFWLARGAVIVIVALQLVVVNDLSLGPRWFAPAVELLLLLPLSVATAWTQRWARRAETTQQWLRVGKNRRRVRFTAIALTALVTLMNFTALARLIAAILAGHAGPGKTLLFDAVNIWVTNVVIFALWYWSLDRGGPSRSGLGEPKVRDFVFTQQQLAREMPQFEDWKPGFVDYLFLAFTNGTAFSPADTFPLTARAKVLMMIESATSLTTIAVVASRAVGIIT